MDADFFLKNVREAFDLRVPDLELGTRFRELGEWDSMTSVSLVAMIYACYDVQISGDQLMACDTLGDLYATVGTLLSETA